MTIEKIRDLAGKLDAAEHERQIVGGQVSIDRKIVEEARAALAWAAVEIELLRASAREGWQEAHDAAQDGGDGQTMELAVKKIAEIGGVS